MKLLNLFCLLLTLFCLLANAQAAAQCCFLNTSHGSSPISSTTTFSAQHGPSHLAENTAEDGYGQHIGKQSHQNAHGKTCAQHCQIQYIPAITPIDLLQLATYHSAIYKQISLAGYSERLLRPPKI